MNSAKCCQRGEATEGAILAELLHRRLSVSIPFGHNHPYDLILEDEDGKLHKVQCKTGCLRRGCIVFNTSSIFRNGKRVGYHGLIDFFLIYCPQNKLIYKMSIDDVSNKSVCHLRVEPMKKSTGKYPVRWAKDYLYV